jgi:hypothetical protein
LLKKEALINKNGSPLFIFFRTSSEENRVFGFMRTVGQGHTCSLTLRFQDPKSENQTSPALERRRVLRCGVGSDRFLYAVNSLSVVGVGGLHRLITRVQREKKRWKGSQHNSSGAAGEVAKKSGVEEEQHEQ